MNGEVLKFHRLGRKEDLVECSSCHCIVREGSEDTHAQSHMTTEVNQNAPTTPKLLLDLHEAVLGKGVRPWGSGDAVHAALAVVVKKLSRGGFEDWQIANFFDIPESLVRGLLDD